MDPLIIETGGVRKRRQDTGCRERDPRSQPVTHPQSADEYAGVLHRELPLLGHDALDGLEDIGGHGDVPADVNVAPLLLQGSVHGFRQLLLQDILHVLLWGVGRTSEEEPGCGVLLCSSLPHRAQTLTGSLWAGAVALQVTPGAGECATGEEVKPT